MQQIEESQQIEEIPDSRVGAEKGCGVGSADVEEDSLETSTLERFEGGDGVRAAVWSWKQRAMAKNEQRFIVDRDISDTSIEGVFMTIQSALAAANKTHLQNLEKGQDIRIKIKIASNLYDLNEEPLVITVPDLVLEPKEKGGEVTLQQDGVPCIIVDVGAGNQVTINNTRMLLKGQEKRMFAKKLQDDEVVQRGRKLSK